MKKGITIILATFFTLLLFTNSKIQDEDCTVCGWYADGVKVERIDCYNFDKLQLVLPYNAGMSGYEKINIWARLETNKSEGLFGGIASEGTNQGVKSLPGSAIKTVLKGNYIVHTIFSKETGDNANLKRDFQGADMTYNAIFSKTTFSKKRKAKKDKEIPDMILVGWVQGASISGYTYEENPNTGSTQKVPTYSTTILSKYYQLKCGNPSDDAACAIMGTKVDLNNLK